MSTSSQPFSPSERTTITVGIVGAGSVATEYHLPVLTELNSVSVEWVCDIDRTRARSVARAFGLRSYEADLAHAPYVDVALLAVPVYERASVWPVLFERSRDVLAEKPFATSLDAHLALLLRAKQESRVLGAGFVRRSFWATKTLANLLSSGAYGSPLGIVASDAERLRRTGRPDWYLGRPTNGSGFLLETGSHLVDQLATVSRATDLVVRAARQVHHRGIEFETAAVGQLSVKGVRLPFALLVSRLRDAFTGIAVDFDRCTLTIGLTSTSPVQVMRDGRSLADFPSPQSNRTSADFDAFRVEWSEFIDRSRARDIETNAHATGVLTTSTIDAVRAASQ